MNSIGITPKLYLQGLLPLSFFLMVIYLVAGEFSFVLLIIPLLYIAFCYLGAELLYFLALFSLLGFSADIGDTFRNVLNGLSILLITAGAFEGVRKNGFKVRPLPGILTIFFMFNIILMLVSSTNSDYFSTGLAETVRQLVFFAVIFLLYQIYNDFNSFQKLIDYLIIIASFVAITIAVSFFSTVNSIEKLITEFLVKEGGLFSNVAAPGGLIGMAIVLLNYRMLSSESKLLKNSGVMMLLMFFLIVGLFLTNSRAAILTAITGTVIVQLFLNTKRFLKYAGILSLVLALSVIISYSFFDIINLYLRTDRVLENTRYVIWDLTLNMIESNFLWGTGPGAAKYMWTQYTNVMFNTWTGDQVAWVYEKGGSGHSHNFLLFRWSELGLFGLISAVWIYLFFPFAIWKNSRNFNSDLRVRNLNLTLLAGIIGLLVRSVLEATGILTNGWVSRDLPFWIMVLIAFHYYSLHNRNTFIKVEDKPF